jgi:hypothetical protein
VIPALLTAATAYGQSESPPPPPTAPAAEGADIVGTWHRAQSCDELVAAFEAAGLLDSHSQWALGNFFLSGEPADPDRLCFAAPGPLEHDHVFTADGAFGSHDEHGEVVDNGDYEVKGRVLVFPSHSDEFGYGADILVAYGVSGDVAAFRVLIPSVCEGACADAHAWALSAFASGPWERVWVHQSEPGRARGQDPRLSRTPTWHSAAVSYPAAMD